jgi:hypothetical protein
MIKNKQTKVSCLFKNWHAFIYDYSWELSIILKIYATSLTPSWNEPDIQCVEGVPLWRESASIINHEFLKGYRQRGGEINEFIAGYISWCYSFFSLKFEGMSMIICKTFSDIPPTNGPLDTINVISNLIDYLSVFVTKWHEEIIHTQMVLAYFMTAFISAGYDFLGTTQYGLGVNVWYNSTYNDNNAYSFIATLRVPRLVNAVCCNLISD